MLLLAALSPAAWPAAAVPRDLDAATRAAIEQAVARSPGFDNRFDAEVWLVDMSHRLASRIPDAGRRLALLRDVHAAATAAGLSPQLVLAVIEVESGFQRFALSSAGARGLMQVMPFWRQEIGTPDDNLFARRTNLRYGCAILAVYLKREQGNRWRALARYNGSLGQSWYPARVERALRQHWQIP
ncbi:transglycosylase SLT domain-containing protein [Salinisphaera sp. Q1T1-3]|uniref:transglycosylase SLT domain-containing protein n=1 Tax=Salinisphaera sp. Q1T1-3 TaxID=2321229 RepID=UPI001F450ECD|nr:transglycosylase SLT domain-containing protein [Salinisphaera sp. Q1T1-3]